ncbi:MAG: hypothetical protein J5804_04925 [Eggerthellaceae bacterium]|nr:hypothetical protein [Eggerthellaceae bacterium]
MIGFSLPIFAITLFAIAAAIFISVKLRGVRNTKSARARILGGTWIPAQDLIAGCADENGEYRKFDGPGCYIILVFDHEVTNGDFGNYREAYVGKSDKAYEAACAQLADLGIEDSGQADQSENNHAYVQVRFYEEKHLGTREETIAKLLKAEK